MAADGSSATPVFSARFQFRQMWDPAVQQDVGDTMPEVEESLGGRKPPDIKPCPPNGHVPYFLTRGNNDSPLIIYPQRSL